MPYTVNPFDVRFLSETPWDPEYVGTPWQRVTSYASLIFVLVCDKWPAHDTAAREWAKAFKAAFRGPYVNIVLPLFNSPQNKPVHELVNHLSMIHGDIKRTGDIATGAQEQLNRSQPDVLRENLCLPPFMVDPPRCLAPEWVEIMNAFRAKRIEPCLIPPEKKKVASPSRRARKKTTRLKNATPTPEGPTKTEARKNVTAWISAACTRLAPFVTDNTYAGLSHRMRKFYEELISTAECVGKENDKEDNNWKYGYILAVSWQIDDVLRYVISNFEGGEEGITTFFKGMKEEKDRLLVIACQNALDSHSTGSSYEDSSWLPSPPHGSSSQTESSQAAEGRGSVQELGQMSLRRFHAPIGVRTARRYGIDQRDAWNGGL